MAIADQFAAILSEADSELKRIFQVFVDDQKIRALAIVFKLPD
jgi:hypothetical protein